MSLDERKRKILKAIIDDFIETAEPVGSRSISKKHEFGISSATIRNEMSDLEDLGYLEQPYTSAGRIPSDAGYRFYVNELMNKIELTNDEVTMLGSALSCKIHELEQLIKLSLGVLSEVTDYTSVGSLENLKKLIVNSVQVVPLDQTRVIVVVVFEGNLIKNNIVRFGYVINAGLLISLTNMINKNIAGLDYLRVKKYLMNNIFEFGILNKETITKIFDAIIECINSIEHSDIFMEGAKNIFNHAEFKDIDRAKNFISLLEEKSTLVKLLNSTVDGLDIGVLIGNESELVQVKDCSIVTTKCSVGNITIGTIGIIGPTRMDYSKIMAFMRYLQTKINNEIKNFLGE